MTPNVEKVPYHHPADEYFDSLVDYLRHLVDRHGFKETPELWRSGRDIFDKLHAHNHGLGTCPNCGQPIIDHDSQERKACHDAVSGYGRLPNDGSES
jgi:hypothetical protein